MLGHCRLFVVLSFLNSVCALKNGPHSPPQDVWVVWWTLLAFRAQLRGWYWVQPLPRSKGQIAVPTHTQDARRSDRHSRFPKMMAVGWERMTEGHWAVLTVVRSIHFSRYKRSLWPFGNLKHSLLAALALSKVSGFQHPARRPVSSKTRTL